MKATRAMTPAALPPVPMAAGGVPALDGTGIAVAAPSRPNPVPGCRRAWRNGSASASSRGRTITAQGSTDCKIEADCPAGPGAATVSLPGSAATRTQ